MMDESPQSTRFMDYLLFRSLKGDASAAEEDRVQEWRRASPANEAYYRELESLLTLTEDPYGPLPPAVSRPPLARELIATHAGAPAHDRAGARLPRGRAALAWAAAAIAAAAAAMVLLMPQSRAAPTSDLLSFGVDEFATGSSDVATVQLRDGTIVRLAPRSRLRLTGSANEREVTLHGRAYFAVAHMEGHPFTVKTGAGEAVVLGTRFEAEARGDELRVLVVEGRVALAASGRRVQLDAGEMARAIEGAVSAAVSVPDPQRSIDWVGDFLVFQSTPIQDVAVELRQYFGLDLEVIGGGQEDQTVTAWFADPVREDVIRVVCTVLAARCSESGGTITIDLTRHHTPGRADP